MASAIPIQNSIPFVSGANVNIGAGFTSTVCDCTVDGIDEPVVVKVTARNDFFKVAADKEALFYSQVAPFLQVPMPRVLRISQDDRAVCIVMQKIDTEQFQLGDQQNGFELNEFCAARRALERLHTSPLPSELQSKIGVVEDYYNRLAALVEDMSGRMTVDKIRDGTGGQLSDERCAAALHMVQTAFSAGSPLFRQALAVLQRLESTAVLHMDYRGGNLFFNKNDASQVVVFDWQHVCCGHAAFDVTYLLAGALTVDKRRELEQSTLDEYCNGTMRDVASFRQAVSLCTLWLVVWAIFTANSLDELLDGRYSGTPVEDGEAKQRATAFFHTSCWRYFEMALDHEPLQTLAQMTTNESAL